MLWLIPAGFYLSSCIIEHENFANGKLRISVYAPRYVSAYEEQDIRVSIENVTNADAYVYTDLLNDGPATSFITSHDSNRVYAGQMRTGEQINRHLKLYFARPSQTPTENTPTGLVLAGATSLPGAATGDPYRIALATRVAPIPETKSTTYYLFAAWVSLLLWIVKEWWDQAKRSTQESFTEPNSVSPVPQPEEA